MHYLVRLIVQAGNIEEAISQADSIMFDLLERNEFDWYSTKDDESRRDECWKPVRLSTKKGLAIVQDAMQDQLAEFKDAMTTIRLMLDQYSDEQIFNEEFERTEGRYLSRYQFSKASGYHANACQLFDTDGSHITSHHELDRYTADPTGAWVVQVDCHN